MKKIVRSKSTGKDELKSINSRLDEIDGIIRALRAEQNDLYIKAFKLKYPHLKDAIDKDVIYKVNGKELKGVFFLKNEGHSWVTPYIQLYKKDGSLGLNTRFVSNPDNVEVI